MSWLVGVFVLPVFPALPLVGVSPHPFASIPTTATGRLALVAVAVMSVCFGALGLVRASRQPWRPGTRAYLSAGLPGADWWVAGHATTAADQADVELDVR